jgi:ComF family protein
MFYEPHSEMAQLIYQMKYNNRPDIGEDMGRLMAQEMKMGGFFESIDVLLPVPISSKRQRQRGYNQSERLAQGISDVTGLPVCTCAVIRQDFQQSQTMLNRQERRKNVEKAFLLLHPEMLANRHVLLIDDVCTTGATLISLGSAIQHIEGIKISILTLGYTKK